MKKEDFNAICDGTYFKINKKYILSDSDINYIVNEIKYARNFFENQLKLLPDIDANQRFWFTQGPELLVRLRFSSPVNSKIFFTIWIKIVNHKIEEFEFNLESFMSERGGLIACADTLEEFKERVTSWLEN